MIGILIVPTENLCAEFFHRTCSFSDVCFLDQLLGFPDCWISLNRSLIFRLRSASSSHFLIDVLEEEL